MQGFMQTLKIQRWDDHRFYHHSLINQSLHLLSATSFVLMYSLLFWDPAIAGMTGWMVSITNPQIGHFFFDPKGYNTRGPATIESGWTEHRAAAKARSRGVRGGP